MLLKEIVDLISEYSPIALYNDSPLYENYIMFGCIDDIDDCYLMRQIKRIFLDGEKEEIAIILDGE